MRFDLRIIASWIEPGSTVLDLGCGEGDLLVLLRDRKGVQGFGIELVESKVARCIARGLSVIQGDMNLEVMDYADRSFDYVVLSRTLQQAYKPDDLIRSMLRIGKRGVVSFPNFGHWRVRWQLLTTGRAPVTRQLPYQWYDTPNIRVLTLKDFRRFSKQVGFEIFREVPVVTDEESASGKTVTTLPNLRATYGIFLIG